jgi:DNA-directed RNA polymerase subunit F
MARQILAETPVNSSDVKKHLEAIQAHDKELTFRAQRTLEHLEAITVLAPKKAKELAEALAKLEIPRLKEQHIHKLIDVLPKTQDEVKLMLQGYAVTVTNENCKKIADTIAEFAK